MTNKSDNTNQTDTSTVKPTEANKRAVAKNSSNAKPVALTAIAAVVIGGFAFWYIKQTQTHLSQKYDSQLQTVVAQSQANARQAQQALTLVQNQTQQIQQLTQQLSQVKDELSDVSTALQTISDTGSDLMLLNDIEQLVTLAQQQLLIGGNLANAIVSLETAQARLSHANRQSLAVLIQTINGDLDRLRAAQVVDIASLTADLERLSELVSQAPLFIPDGSNTSINGEETISSEPEASVAETPVADNAAWWEKAIASTVDVAEKSWQTLSHDLGQFISIRRVDDAAALLMSPDQADRFRENLRLRVTLAQLALLTKQPKVWEAEMGRIVQLIEQRFDPSLAVTQRSLLLATQLADTKIDVKLPTIANTLAAIENLKQADQNKLGTESREIETEIEAEQTTTETPQAVPSEPSESTEPAQPTQPAQTETDTETQSSAALSPSVTVTKAASHLQVV